MTISKEEAQQALVDIESTMRSTRRAIANGAASPRLILWGFIWIIGYAGAQFFPAKMGLIWIVLGGVGALLTARIRRPTQTPHGPKIGFFWLTLFAYAFFWFFLLFRPDPGVSDLATMNRITAFFATVPMFAYVVGGLWFGRFFTILGLAVTALTMLGFWLLPNWFHLWMAFTGGGSLIGSGLYIRLRWK